MSVPQSPDYQVLLFVVRDGDDKEAIKAFALFPSDSVEFIGLMQVFVQRGIHVLGNETPPPLQLALENGKSEVIELLVRIDYREDNTFSRSWIYGRSMDKDILSPLLDGFINFAIEARSGHFGYNVHPAVHEGNADAVEHIFSHGANIYSRHAWGVDCETLLHLAVNRGHVTLARLLLKHGAKFEAQMDSGSPLLIAMICSHHKLIELFLDKLGYCDTDIFQVAIGTKCLEIVKLVLKYRLELSNRGNGSALCLALCQHGGDSTRIVDLLLEAGFDVTPEDVFGGNALLMCSAVAHNKFKIVKQLVNYGADINCYLGSSLNLYYGGRTKVLGGTVLHTAAMYSQGDDVQFLLDHGADIEAKPTIDYSEEPTPLFYAVKHSNIEAVGVLLANGANIHHEQGLLHAAALAGCSEIVDMLLKNGLDPNSEWLEEEVSCGKIPPPMRRTFIAKTPIFLAARGGHIKVLDILLKYGANINAEDERHNTVLHEAAAGGFVNSIEFLIINGASMNTQSVNHMTPMYVAAENGHLKAFQALLKFGANPNLKCTFISPLHLLFERPDYQILELEDILSRVYAASVVACETAVNDLFSFCPKNHKTVAYFLLKLEAACSITVQDSVRALDADEQVSIACREEVERLQHELVGDTVVPFYGVLTGSADKIARFVRNEKFVQAFESENLKTRFPYYSGIIKSQFQKGRDRKELLDQGVQDFDFLFPQLSKLPDLIKDQMLFRLGDKDLLALRYVCKPMMKKA